MFCHYLWESAQCDLVISYDGNNTLKRQFMKLIEFQQLVMSSHSSIHDTHVNQDTHHHTSYLSILVHRRIIEVYKKYHMGPEGVLN